MESAVENNKLQETVKEEYFTFLGQHEFIDQDGFPVSSIYDNMACKATTNSDGDTKYFIKLNSKGEAFALENNTEYKDKVSRVLSQDIRFKRVNQETFDYYKMYLKTNSKVYLKEVERRMV